MTFEKGKSISPDDLSSGRTDHLRYLKWDFSLFGNEEDDRILQTNLVCAVCAHPVTTVSEKIEVTGRHDYRFTNLGYPVHLGCYRYAPGCTGIERVSYGYSWFRGYAWQIQLCAKCFTQLGWKYMSGEDCFYGLVFKMLREVTEENKAGQPPSSAIVSCLLLSVQL
ncbi:MAG: cereblon family protein [Pseudomonadota bacterium]